MQNQALAHSTLIGRDSEIAQLRKWLDGTSGQCLLICGDPGIGKTRLLQWLCKDVVNKKSRLLTASCPHTAGAPPWWVWSQIISGMNDSELTDEDRNLLETILDPEYALEPGIQQIATTDSGTNKLFQLFDYLIQLLNRLAKDKRVIIAIDDLHWADELSLRLLEFIVGGLSSTNILIVATYRDSELSRRRPLGQLMNSISVHPSVKRIRLGGISEEAMFDLMSALTHESLKSDLVQSIYRQTGGNPLYATEITRYLTEQGFLFKDSSSLPHVMRVPESIRDLVAERLAHLSAECRDVLEAASALGLVFSVSTITAMNTSCDVSNCLAAIDEATGARILQESPAIRGQYEFIHALIREAIYDDMSRSRRMRWHRSAAKAIEQDPGLAKREAVALAGHWLESSTQQSLARAAHYFIQAAEHARALAAYEDAVVHFESAVECMSSNDDVPPAQMGQCLLSLGNVQRRAGHNARAMTTFNEVIAIAEGIGNVAMQADAVLGYETARWRSALPASGSIMRLQEALDKIPEQPSRVRVQLLAALSRARSYAHDDQGAIALATSSIAIARDLNDAALLCDTLGDAVVAMHRQPTLAHQRLKYCQEAAHVAASIGDDSRLADAYSTLRGELAKVGDVAEFDRCVTEHEAIAKRLREPHHLYQVEFVHVFRALLEGNYDAVLQLSRRAMKAGSIIEGANAAGVNAMQMFALFRDTGRLQQVVPLLNRVEQKGCDTIWGPGMTLLQLEVGNKEQAAARFSQMAAHNFSNIARDELWLTSLAFASEVCVTLDDHQHAETLYQSLEPYGNSLVIFGPCVVCFGSVDYYLGLLATTLGETHHARAHFEKAIALCERANALPWLARSYFALHKYCSSSPRQTRTENPLAKAMDIAERLGMHALLEQCRAQSKGITIGTGIEALTKREIDVVKLIAKGGSNQEIADRLCISHATVATHVRNVLGKTGARNRTEVATLALQEGIGVKNTQV